LVNKARSGERKRKPGIANLRKWNSSVCRRLLLCMGRQLKGSNRDSWDIWTGDEGFDNLASAG